MLLTMSTRWRINPLQLRVIVWALTVEAGSGRDGDPDNAEIIFQVKQRVARGHDFTLQCFSKGYSGMRTEV